MDADCLMSSSGTAPTPVNGPKQTDCLIMAPSIGIARPAVETRRLDRGDTWGVGTRDVPVS